MRVMPPPSTRGLLTAASFVTQDPAWNEVTEAIGALYLLVKDGKAQSGFEATAAPRTVGHEGDAAALHAGLVDRRQVHALGVGAGGDHQLGLAHDH